MTILELLDENPGPSYSLEILPSTNVPAALKPLWIAVTNHGGMECAAACGRYHDQFTVVPHVRASNPIPGFENVFVVRGEDVLRPYAAELVPQWLGACIGVAGYPERHPDAPDFESDIRFLKAKVDAGADYIVTQMFFENSLFYKFVERCRAAGIEVPILPGLKIFEPGQRDFGGVKVPKIGADPVGWTRSQILDLRAQGFAHVQLFMLGDGRVMELAETFRA
jgi:hypothetical protein